MSNAIEHFSRYRVEDTTLQVMADLQRDLDRLIREEKSVIRHYVRLGNWPHKRVNMFVLENLQPLVAQIKGATKLSSVIANDIDRRPMVNVYDAADLTECAVFVNRGALERDGVWNDDLALRALLAHEHGHPARRERNRASGARAFGRGRSWKVEPPTAAVGPILQLLADRLCVHAPQEVFANEVAIRAGFADALFHLDKGVIDKARLSVSERPSLVQGLEQQAPATEAERGPGGGPSSGRRSCRPICHLRSRLAPFLRAGHRRQAEALEAALIEGVLSHLDPAALPLYEKLRDHYLQLRTDLSSSAAQSLEQRGTGFPDRCSPAKRLAGSLRTAFGRVPAANRDALSARNARTLFTVPLDHDGGLVMRLAPARMPKVHTECDVAQYLYCIVRCREPRTFETLGMGERGDVVHTINFEDLAAVASDSPEARYDNTRRNMMAHMRVLDEVMADHTVLPSASTASRPARTRSVSNC